MTSTIKVANIKHSNDTTAMTIDTTGRVLTPARPYLWADCYNGSSAGYDAVGNFSTVPYRRIISGVGITLSNSTYAWTIPVTGLYQVNATILNNNVENLEICLTVGGSSSSNIVFRSYSNADHRTCYIHHAIAFTAGDECRILNCSGNTNAYHRNNNANDRYTALSVYLIG